MAEVTRITTETLSTVCVSDFLIAVVPSVKKMLRMAQSNSQTARAEESMHRRACVDQILAFMERYGIHKDVVTYLRTIQELWNFDPSNLPSSLNNQDRSYTWESKSNSEEKQEIKCDTKSPISSQVI